jgi:hypothetical protein
MAGPRLSGASVRLHGAAVRGPSHCLWVFGMAAGAPRHPTAAVWLAIDRDADVVNLTHGYKWVSPEQALYAEAIQAWGTWIPGVADASG